MIGTTLLVSASAFAALALHRRRREAPAAIPDPKRCSSADLELPRWEPLPPQQRARIRDRYVATRFPEFFLCASDLDDWPAVVEAARLYFEEESYDRADELLEMAIEINPGCKELRLAQLQIAFLRGQVEHYVALAAALRESVPPCAEWREVQSLGRVLAPAEPSFTKFSARRGHDRLGLPSGLPNWIGASWDLAAEVRGCQFHHAVATSA